MPEYRVLHERDAFTLHRMGDYDRRSPPPSGQSLEHRRETWVVMAVDLDDSPVEALPFLTQWLQRQCFRHRGQTLDFIVVYDRHEVVQRVVRREKRGLPC